MKNDEVSCMSNQDASGMPFRVLSIDGGGIRGLYAAVLLQQLSRRFSGKGASNEENREFFDLGRKFDLIVGTSTGAILSVALAAGISLEKVIELYGEKGREIFQNPLPPKKSRFYEIKLMSKLFQAWGRPINNTRNLHRHLFEILGDETLEQLYERRKIALCIPSVNAETERSWIFKTPHFPRLKRDKAYRLVDVCMASTAVPIYLPLYAVASKSGTGNVCKFIDGGLWANNPVMVGLVEALEMSGTRPIEILSVGTLDVSPSRIIPDEDCEWGVYKWLGGIEIVKMSMEAQAFSIPYMVEQISKSLGRVTYHRLMDPKISSEYAPHLALDAVDNESIKALIKLAECSVDDNHSYLTKQGEEDSKEKQMARNMFSELEKL